MLVLNLDAIRARVRQLLAYIESTLDEEMCHQGTVLADEVLLVERQFELRVGELVDFPQLWLEVPELSVIIRLEWLPIAQRQRGRVVGLTSKEALDDTSDLCDQA